MTIKNLAYAIVRWYGLGAILGYRLFKLNYLSLCIVLFLSSYIENFINVHLTIWNIYIFYMSLMMAECL